jgi:hypothetical protein
LNWKVSTLSLIGNVWKVFFRVEASGFRSKTGHWWEFQNTTFVFEVETVGD